MQSILFGKHGRKWRGDAVFLMQSLIEKDFKVRYRNMSLGVFWSLLNPLVTMGVLWVVFTKIMKNANPHFATFLLCGLVPFNFFTLAWLASTTSLVDNAGLIKRLTVPREIVPLSVVLGNSVHFGLQVLLLLVISLATGLRPNIYWLWLPYILFCELVFICGLGLMFFGSECLCAGYTLLCRVRQSYSILVCADRLFLLHHTVAVPGVIPS